ncbi:hypothetical protein B7494_g2804 [Chlorociboria aeruginascens]|nr:hypothetical protein B7494_g2804 [Chlorociboria aeruginascens]
MVGKKKRGHPDVEELLARPWCYYCERDFDDLKILISHQKAKHFKCERCGRRLNTAGGLSVHMNQVHKETLQSVENSLPNRQGLEVEIFGMEGIPEDVTQAHNQRIIAGFYQAEAERRAATGNPGPGGNNGGQPKKPKFESPADLKKRLAEHKARKAEQAAAGSSGGNTPMDGTNNANSPMGQSPGPFNGSPFPNPQTNFGAASAPGYGSHPQDSFNKPPAPYQQSFPPQPAYSGPPGAQYQPQFSPPQQYSSQQPFPSTGYQPPFPSSFNGYQNQATPPLPGGLPNRPPSLPPAPGLPQRPAFGALPIPSYQMQQMHQGQGLPHQQGWAGKGWNGQEQNSAMSSAYPPHSQAYNGDYSTNASSVDDLVSGAARQADDIDEIIRMAEAGIRPTKKIDTPASIATVVPTTAPEATPIHERVEPTEKKSKKDKGMKMIYSDNDISPEEKMAMMPRYAFIPDGKNDTILGEATAVPGIAGTVDESRIWHFFLLYSHSMAWLGMDGVIVCPKGPSPGLSSGPSSNTNGFYNPRAPQSSKQNVSVTEGGKTTVYYTYNPPTSDILYAVGPAQNFTGPALLNNSTSKTVIIAGTINKSPLIDALVTAGKIDVTPITSQWESFISQVVNSPLPGIDRALVIAGSDLRGTVYGLYDISEQIGVSPWYWFADVPAKKQSGIWALDQRKVQKSPSVKYRGIFINDEQPALANWIAVNYESGKYGLGFNHFFYSNVFELLLRLRANYFWPAMWGSMFNVDDYANQPLADAYGIVMGTSHTEPMMRATNEWTTFGSEYGGDGQWLYNTNNASLNEFFRYGAQRTMPYAGNSLFSIAMRGSGDTAIPLTQSQAMATLADVIASQTQIFENVFNETNVSDIPQLWCLYSEVQGYFEAGLSVPDYVTLLWVDDNFGDMRRLPLANETSRAGGAGVYYHVDYVGSVRDYKWINTIQLEKTNEQMQLAIARQANRIWILNVGDLKPLEIPINHFLDMAYDSEQWGYNSVATWLTAWATREFGLDLASNITSVLDRYGMYAARRKYELIDPTTYSQLNYNEAEAILAQWAILATDAQAIYDKLGEDAQPAFYEMVLQPVLGGQVVNQIYIDAGRNWHFTEQKRNAANSVVNDVLFAFNQDHVLTQRYHDLLGGKWSHMLDQTHLGYDYWQQPMRNALPPLSYVQELETSLAGNIGVAIESSNATVSGDDNWHTLSSDTLVLPPMDRYGPKTRWIDIFARGLSDCDWTISPGTDYVIVTPSSGTTGGANGTDTRVYVSIDWSKAPAAPNTTTVSMNITSSCPTWGNYGPPVIQVPVVSNNIPSSFVGFVESDGHIAIEAAHTTSDTIVDGISYLTLSSYGRTLSGVTLSPALAPSQGAGTGPVLEYDLYTFTNTSIANITLYLSPSLNAAGPTHPLKYAIALDNENPQTIQFVANTTGGGGFLPPNWNGAASDSIWGLSSGNGTTTTHDFSKTGEHTLKVWLMDAGAVVQKIIVDFGGVRPSYLGPPESFRAGVDTLESYQGLNFAGVQTSPSI